MSREASAGCRRVVVVGGGAIGASLAALSLAKGMTVRLIERSEASGVEDAVTGRLRKIYSRRESQDAQLAAAKSRLTLQASLSGNIDDADIVVEAVPEDEALKIRILKAVAEATSSGTVIATTTSTLSITKLGMVAAAPERVVGLHFMYPLLAMPLVEVVPGLDSADQAVEKAEEFVRALAKTPIRVQDFPGFIVIRVLLPMINEAIFALYEGVGTVASIDRAMQLGANHRQGPLSLADSLGLDICLQALDTLSAGLADSRYRPCPLLKKYVEAGWLGIRSKRGFYDYASKPPKPTR